MFRSATMIAALERLGCALLIGLALVGCQPAKPKAAFHSVDITGTRLDPTPTGKPGFELLDSAGKTHTLADYRGKVVLVFFGYTHCPDICPTVLATVSQALTQLDASSAPLSKRSNGQTAQRASDQVQLLFVTVDPERDTPQVLAQYVPAFDSRFAGLRAKDEATLRETAARFKVFYQRVPGSSPDTYTVDHTAGLYALDRKGQMRLFIRQNISPEDLAQDLRLLLDAA